MPICIDLCVFCLFVASLRQLRFVYCTLSIVSEYYSAAFLFRSLCPNAIPPLFLLFQADYIRRSLFAISLFFFHKNSQKHHFFSPRNLHISKFFRTFAPDL